ncbi:MAG: carbamoyltransferase [Candidatus Omnitrophota bacterium]|jgi:carbamoyltransferase
MRDIYILGISAFYHDSAAALLKNGVIIAAAQEERFTRKKHDADFPEQAISYCLREVGISPQEINYISFYEKPFIKFERLLATYFQYAPRGFLSFSKSMPVWAKQKLFIKSLIEEKVSHHPRILFNGHHESHAASAFYPSPFEEAAILTMDGVGEWVTASFGIGKGNRISLVEQIKFPHSLGLLYSAFTYYVGFRVNSGEYKLMGLAPYGEPAYVDVIKKELVDIKEDGSFQLNMKYFNYCVGLTMTNNKFHVLFGGKPRRPDKDVLEQRHMDIARSIQAVTEEIMLKIARHVYRQTGQKYLCLAGGVALNCVANGLIAKDGPFKKIWVQPAATDAGGALGAAFAAWYGYLRKERLADGVHDAMRSSLLGPEFSNAKIEVFLKEQGVVYEAIERVQQAKVAARIIAEQKVLGWFQGRMEFGPRALGNRSIVADPRSLTMQSMLNVKIKFRESFRPFAPAVLADKARDYFDFDGDSPYMLMTVPLKERLRLPIREEQNRLSGINKLKIKRSEIPAVTHVDYSARLQTVTLESNWLFYDLINEFYSLTACPMVINTSFNVRGEPIVCSPQEAYECFMRTDMDYLMMGSFLVDKAQQQKPLNKRGKSNEFEPD